MIGFYYGFDFEKDVCGRCVDVGADTEYDEVERESVAASGGERSRAAVGRSRAASGLGRAPRRSVADADADAPRSSNGSPNSPEGVEMCFVCGETDASLDVAGYDDRWEVNVFVCGDCKDECTTFRNDTLVDAQEPRLLDFSAVREGPRDSISSKRLSFASCDASD